MLLTEENICFKYFTLQRDREESSMIKSFIIVSLKLAKLMPIFCGRFHGQLGKYTYKMDPAPKITKPITDYA